MDADKRESGAAISAAIMWRPHIVPAMFMSDAHQDCHIFVCHSCVPPSLFSNAAPFSPPRPCDGAHPSSSATSSHAFPMIDSWLLHGMPQTPAFNRCGRHWLFDSACASFGRDEWVEPRRGVRVGYLSRSAPTMIECRPGAWYLSVCTIPCIIRQKVLDTSRDLHSTSSASALATSRDQHFRGRLPGDTEHYRQRRCSSRRRCMK